MHNVPPERVEKAEEVEEEIEQPNPNLKFKRLFSNFPSIDPPSIEPPVEDQIPAKKKTLDFSILDKFWNVNT